MLANFFLLFLLLHTSAKFTFKPLFGYRAMCVFDSSTSFISREELQKFTSFFGQVKWTEEVNKEISRFDFLILSKGDLSFEEKEIIFDFLKKGGGFVLFLPRVYNQDFYHRLGIYTYNPLRSRIKDVKLHPLVSGFSVSSFDFYKGIIVKTGYGGEITPPARGNVFPERIPVRDFQILVSGVDSGSELIVSGVVSVKHFHNPWNIKGKKPRNWLILSGYKYNFDVSFYKKLYAILVRRVYVENISAKLPVYYLKEKPEIMVGIEKSGKGKVEIKAILEIYNRGGKKIYSSWRKKIIKTSQNLVFTPGIKFKPGIYTIRVLVYEHRIGLIDSAENMFLYAPDELLKDTVTSRLSVNRGKFFINGRPQFIWGTNYYESRKGELNWLWPDLASIDKDFRLMRKLGLNMVRIHYHHPQWFRDYLRKIGSDFLNFFPPKKYLPGEEDLRILDALIYLARLNNLIICLDIFTLVPEEMGDPRGWLGMTERIEDEDRIENQLKFVHLIATRYRNVGGITWDLWNEPRLGEDKLPVLKNWAQKIINEFRKNGDKHLITVGGNDSIYLKDIVDYISIHTDYIMGEDMLTCLTYYQGSIPVILQEFWLASSLLQETQQAEKLKAVLSKITSTQYQGFLPWQWTRQSRLWDKSQPEKWDDDLGLFLREDGSLKPAFFTFEKWILDR